MKERLEDLISEADKMLQEREEVARARNGSISLAEEVDHDTSARLNQTYFEPKVAFWKRYPRAAGLLTIILVLMMAARIYVIVTMPRASGQYRDVTATVQSITTSPRSQGYGLRSTIVRLILPNGNLVTLQVTSDAMLSVGSAVPVRLYDTGAVQFERTK